MQRIHTQDLLTQRNYLYAIFILCLSYIVFQFLYIPHVELGADEFWFAHHIYRYTQGLPYRDFPPYKTVLGYYLLSLPLYLSHGVLSVFYHIKNEIALINTLMLGISVYLAAKIFNPRNIFYTLLIIICGQWFLVRGTELRVDMLTSWLCLLSALLYLNRRTLLAGVFIGLAFLISQKALWYIGAMEIAIASNFFTRDSFILPERPLKSLVRFNLACLLVVALYIGFWSLLSNLHAVLYSMFYEAYALSAINYYTPMKMDFWSSILFSGPVLIMLLPLTVLSLFDEELTPSARRSRIFIIAYAFSSILAMMQYTQFYPYHAVFFIPAFFLLYSEFFGWLFQPRAKLISHRLLFWFFSLYIIALLGVMIALRIQTLYFLTILIPVMLWAYLEKNRWTGNFICLAVIAASLLVTGVLYPLQYFLLISPQLDNHYQKSMLHLLDGLVADGSDYAAGVLLFHDKDQVPPGFKNIITPVDAYTWTNDPALLPIFMASLDMTARTAPQMIQALKDYPVKVLVNSYRMALLAPSIVAYMHSQYLHYWGNIYLYAPEVEARQTQFTLKFSGNYALISHATSTIIIDGKTVAAPATLQLSKGQHLSQANSSYRLEWLPENASRLPAGFQYDCATCFLKPIAI